MSRFPQVPTAPRSTAIPFTTGRVSVRDPDGGRHVIEVIARDCGLSNLLEYQVRVDGWYEVTWASSANEVESALDRLRNAITAGWLPGDSNLPK